MSWVLIWTDRAKKDLVYLKDSNLKLAVKIVRLAQSIQDDPFAGIGKPEPLKLNLSGYWSRRIDKKNRLIYRVDKGEVLILSCKGHYD